VRISWCARSIDHRRDPATDVDSQMVRFWGAVLWPVTAIIVAPAWAIDAVSDYRTARRERLRLERGARETPTTKGVYR
jgi:hypothetical protein